MTLPSWFPSWFPSWLPAEHVFATLHVLLRMGLILVLAVLTSMAMHRVVRALRKKIVLMTQRHFTGADEELEKRAETLGGIIRKSGVAIIWTIAGTMILREAGVDIAPILAGAGIIGVAVGFGAQYLVRDLIAGLFFLMENQVRVNDWVVLNGVGGTVEELNLRTTVLRDRDGTVHVFPNGAVEKLSNMSLRYAFAAITVGISYAEDPDRVMALLKELGDEMREDPAWRALILEPLEILGVDEFADSAVTIRARIKTRPTQQWAVGREMNRRIKRRFDREGVEIPFPQRTLHIDTAGAPLQIALDPQSLAALRDVVAALARPGATTGAATGAAPGPDSKA